jgi:hypothetical protein
MTRSRNHFGVVISGGDYANELDRAESVYSTVSLLSVVGQKPIVVGEGQT